MRRRWFVLLESNTTGTGRLFVEAAANLGFRPLLLAADPAKYPYAHDLGIDIRQIDTRNRSALRTALRKVAARDGLAGITSSSEYFIGTAAALARHCHLPGPSPQVIRICRDKQRQRELLHQAGICQPLFCAAASVKQAVAAARSLGFPVVVKPVKGSGSVGVRFCENADAVAAHSRALLRQRRNERGLPLPHRILVESVADGILCSAETFGEQIVGITRSCLGPLPHFVEMGHQHPAGFSAALERSIHDTVHRIFEVLLPWGAMHIEMRLASRAPRVRVIEVNPRLAGGFIPELVRLASGVDLVTQTIRAAAGLETNVSPAVQRHAALRFLLAPRAGTLVRAAGMRSAARAAHIAEVRLYAKPGDTVHVRGDFRDRLGHVIACADTCALACAASDDASRPIRLLVKAD